MNLFTNVVHAILLWTVMYWPPTFPTITSSISHSWKSQVYKENQERVNQTRIVMILLCKQANLLKKYLGHGCQCLDLVVCIFSSPWLDSKFFDVAALLYRTSLEVLSMPPSSKISSARWHTEHWGRCSYCLITRHECSKFPVDSWMWFCLSSWPKHILHIHYKSNHCQCSTIEIFCDLIPQFSRFFTSLQYLFTHKTYTNP